MKNSFAQLEPWRKAILLAGLSLVALAIALLFLYQYFEQPMSQRFGATVTSGPTNQKVVALTYDDGPNPPYTGAILRVLEKEHVHATFFLVGRAVIADPADVRREARDGDAIGNHTWDHRHLVVMTRTQIRRSMQRTDDAIYAVTHRHTHIMRPPFGARDWPVMQVLRKMGYTVVMWSVPLAKDWEYPPASLIAARELKRVRDGSIVVLHDGNRGLLCRQRHLNPHVCDRSRDIEATRIIVRELKRRGFRFLTIPQLIAAGAPAKRTPAPGTE